MKVGFLGTGHIAAPMARLAARNGHAVTVSRRNEAVSSDLAAAGLGIAVAGNAEVVANAEVVVLSLRPGSWHDVVAGLPWRPDHRVLSVMAGVPLADIAAACAPVADISVTIPLGHLESGGCPLPVWPGPEPAATLFGPANPVIPVPSEDAIGPHFAASAVLSALLPAISATAGWLAARTGEPDAAEAYVAHLAASYLGALSKDRAGRAAEALDGLATPMTLNNTMLQALRDAGFEDALTRALDAMERGDLK
ncbi:NAD(P)-binding domain-containing protein [Rhodobacterales bacterium HKCCE2091]|nr:NAD(P)-binding domain-containing protein [Rhodobacterales bacterium HKCCE2091]